MTPQAAQLMFMFAFDGRAHRSSVVRPAEDREETAMTRFAEHAKALELPGHFEITCVGTKGPP
jgi:hypothetical protein